MPRRVAGETPARLLRAARVDKAHPGMSLHEPVHGLRTDARGVENKLAEKRGALEMLQAFVLERTFVDIEPTQPRQPLHTGKTGTAERAVPFQLQLLEVRQRWRLHEERIVQRARCPAAYVQPSQARRTAQLLEVLLGENSLI